MSQFIGVDLHKIDFTVCFMEGEEKRIRRTKLMKWSGFEKTYS